MSLNEKEPVKQKIQMKNDGCFSFEKKALKPYILRPLAFTRESFFYFFENEFET